MVPFLKVLMISLGGLGKKGCLLGLQLGKGVQEVMAEENGVDDSDDCVSIGPGLGFVRVVSDIRPCTDPTRLYPVQEASQTRSDGTKVVRISSSVRYRPSLGGEGSGTDRVLTRVPESYPDHQPPRKSASKPPLRANQPDDWLSWLLWLSGGAHRWSTISVT
jgi:hypothetical protein